MNRETLKGLAAPKIKDVEIPEWGGKFTIRQLTARQVADRKAADEDKSLAVSAAYSLVGDDGTLLYDATNEADLAEIQSFSIQGLLRLNEEIMEFNKVGKTEDAEKN